MKVIEEAVVEDMDEEDLKEKALIGLALKRNYEKEMSDSASNSHVKVSTGNSAMLDHNTENADLTESMLSGGSGTKSP